MRLSDLCVISGAGRVIWLTVVSKSNVGILSLPFFSVFFFFKFFFIYFFFLLHILSPLYIPHSVNCEHLFIVQRASHIHFNFYFQHHYPAHQGKLIPF